MIRDSIYDTFETELKRLEKLLYDVQEELKNAPEGFLYIRDTGKNYSHYQVIRNVENKLIHNKTTDRKLIGRLLRKAQNKATRRICRNNIKTLKKAIQSYKPLVPEQLLSPKQRQLQIDLFSSAPPAPYIRAPFDPKSHKHETMYGDLVRSKSEVIIANALWHYGIPFNYEELFPYKDEDGVLYYPDFTIHCPDGTVIIWEHWGLLNKKKYCTRNANKLYLFNQNGFVIGKNLIITQDDALGNCCTVLIYHIIENYILPHFQ